jgi:hypothetical protein
MEGQTAYLSKSGFAAQQGWSPSYVTKLKKQGRLVLSDDGALVDVAATLIRLSDTEDPAKEVLRQFHAASRVEKHVNSQVRLDAPPASEPPLTSAADPKYWQARANREESMAQLAYIELQRQQGALVERARVEAAAFAISRMLRDSILGLPVKLAPELATMTDAFQTEMKLRDALRQVLADIAKLSEQDLAQALEPAH